MRHLHMMGTREAVFHRLVPALVRQMGAAYPELARAEAFITETMRLEEERFKAMLERGLGLLADETARLGEGGTLPGAVAFKLYDTFGFPLDLTQDALREQSKAVDVAGFDAAMAEQRVRARAAWSGTGDAATERVWFDLRETLGATEFLGYSTERAEAEILAVVADGTAVEEAGAGDRVEIVLNQTPFYAESGGQVGDAGRIQAPGLLIEVDDTHKRVGDLFVHLGATVGRLSICAEAIALGRVVMDGDGTIECAVAVRHPKPDESVRDIAVVSPCGACRENLLDFDPAATVIVPTPDGLRRVPLRSLLPVPYQR